MSKLEDDFYLVLEPTSRTGLPINGQRRVTAFKVVKITRNKPFTNRDQVAVRQKLSLDASLFDAVVPVVEIELGAQDLFVNTKVEVLAQEPPEEDE